MSEESQFGAGGLDDFLESCCSLVYIGILKTLDLSQQQQESQTCQQERGQQARVSFFHVLSCGLPPKGGLLWYLTKQHQHEHGWWAPIILHKKVMAGDKQAQRFIASPSLECTMPHSCELLGHGPSESCLTCVTTSQPSLQVSTGAWSCSLKVFILKPF